MSNLELKTPFFNISEEEIKTHLVHYLILIFIILVGGISFIFFQDHIIRFTIGLLLVVSYILWGIFHHFLESNLNSKIVIEYILIGILSIIFLGGLLL